MKAALLIVVGLLFLPLSAGAQSVDVLWQGETYTPPFFQGRALWTKQSGVVFTAIPQGLGDKATLNYRWSKNSTVLGSLSGLGKNTLRVLDTVLSKPITIKVEIMAENKSVVASGMTTLSPRETRVVVYENHPLYGFLFNLESYDGYPVRGEVGFTAFPFYFDTPTRLANVLDFAWELNSKPASSESDIVFRAPEGERGEAEVGVKIKHSQSLFQTGEKNLLLRFEGHE